jgi:predicted Zn finger-like uncharacterized protein
MKHNCPRCKKEFALSAKLAGKQLRVRCTSCGTVFRMRLPAAAAVSAPAAPAAQVAPAAPAVSSVKAAAPAIPPPPRPPDPQHKYFAVIGGKRLGPMPFAALKRLVGEEKITAQTLLWRKGLPEWLPASQVRDVSTIFGIAPPPLPKPAAPRPPPLKAAPSKDDVTKAAALAAERAVEAARLSAAPKDFEGKVTGDVLEKFVQVDPDEEPTDQEVDLDDVDNAFFAVGERTSEASLPSRDIGEIELSDGPLFPVEMEAQHVEKDARTSLKDFSVMVTLSRRSRRKGVFALVALAVVSVATVTLIFTFGDPMGWKGKKITEVELNAQGHRGLYAEQPQNKKKVEETSKAHPTAPVKRQDNGEDPEELLRKMEEKEWTVSLDEDEMAVDREELAAKLGTKKSPNNGVKKNSSGKKTHSRDGKRVNHKGSEDEEMSLEEFANATALNRKEVGSAFKASEGGAKTVEKTIGKGMESAMGDGFGGSRKLKERMIVANVKERAGDGSALKARVGRRVSKKVSAERKSIKSCMDRFADSYSGPGGQLKASLHFNEKGAVSRVTIKGGGDDLEQCFAKIFDGWHVSTITRKIKIPIAVRFK